MGHEVLHYTYDVKESKEHIESKANEDAIYASDSRSELVKHIRFLEYEIYSDLEKAHEAIKKEDDGWYDQLAVQYYSYEKRSETKSIQNLRARIEKAKEDLVDYKKKNSVKNRKSEFIGCSECGSKINKNYVKDFRWNECPLCSHDLSSKTLANAVLNKEEKIKEMRSKLNEDIKANDKKGKKSVKWLVKTEYHI